MDIRAWTNAASLDATTVINLEDEYREWKVGDRIEVDTMEPATEILLVSQRNDVDDKLVLKLSHKNVRMTFAHRADCNRLEPYDG